MSACPSLVIMRLGSTSTITSTSHHITQVTCQALSDVPYNIEFLHSQAASALAGFSHVGYLNLLLPSSPTKLRNLICRNRRSGLQLNDNRDFGCKHYCHCRGLSYWPLLRRSQGIVVIHHCLATTTQHSPQIHILLLTLIG